MRFRYLVLALALGLFGFWATREDPWRSLRQPRCDFLAFYWGGRAAIEGYSPAQAQAEGLRRSFIVTDPEWSGSRAFLPAWLYPPTSSLLFAPFALGSERAGQYLWTGILCAAALSILWFGCLIAQDAWAPWVLALWLGPTLLACLRGTCPEVLNTALVLWGVYRLEYTAGWCRLGAGALALPMLLKPGVELAWLWPYLWLRPWGGQVARIMLGVVVSLVLLTLLRWGPEPWLAWVDTWPAIMRRASGYSRPYTLGSVLWVALAIRWCRQAEEQPWY